MFHRKHACEIAIFSDVRLTKQNNISLENNYLKR